MKAFVTGATGVLGRRVIKLLLSKNITVVALSRSTNNSEFLEAAGAEIMKANLFSATEMIAATQGCDAIFHLATAIPKKKIPKLSDWQLNDRIRIDGTRNLVEAAIANKIDTFICQGITAIYGQQNGQFISERTPVPNDQVKMVESSVAMESIIREKSNDQFLILRFGHFYAPDAFHTQDMIADVRKGKMPKLGKGDFYSNFIHIDDAASAIVFGLENYSRLKGHSINVTDFQPIQFSEYLEKLSALTGGKRPFRLPLFLAKILLGRNVLAYLTNSYRIRADPMFKDWKPKHTDVISGMQEIIMQTAEQGK